ncbi:MAG TPA: hypothetical protein VIT90_09095 [Lysobacter sp.]
MRELSKAEVGEVNGAGWLGVSGETWGCAIGGTIGGISGSFAGGIGGYLGSGAGCIGGAAIANSGSGGGSLSGGPAGAWYLLTKLN